MVLNDKTRKLTQHEIIFPKIYNVKGFGKVKNYQEIDDMIAVILTAHISNWIHF